MIEWILTDASFQGSIRFATIDSVSAELTNVRAFDATTFSTITAAILHYADLVDIDSRRAGCVMAVSGPVFPNTISIARSRWTFSRDGIAQMFGGNAFLLNDVVAVAWSLLDPSVRPIEPFIGVLPHLTEAGCRTVILLDDGIGAATITADNWGVNVTPTEPGHTGFAPRTLNEAAILDELRPRHPHVTWERVLCESALLAKDTVKWAAVAGEFVGDVMLSTAAWNGAILTGRQALRLLAPEAKAAFSGRLATKFKYSRQLAAAPCGLLRQRDPLLGCREFVRRRLTEGGSLPSPRGRAVASVAGEPRPPGRGSGISTSLAL